MLGSWAAAVCVPAHRARPERQARGGAQTPVRGCAQPAAMILHDEIAALRARIARRETERDAMRASGRQEKYLAAFCVVESLERQLERLRQQGLGTSMKNHARYPASAPGTNPAVIAEVDGD
jgi:hypothetical protein